MYRWIGSPRRADGSRPSSTRWGVAAATVPPSCLPGFLIQNPSREDPNVKTLHLFSTEHCPLGKKEDAMRRIVMVFCILSGFVAASWADPSPTPNHITSRIPRQSVESSAIAKVGYSKRRHILEIEFVNGAIYRY